MSHKDDVIRQSKAAYGQWKELWRKHATHHKEYEMKPLSQFQNSGIGKTILCIANGASFEENIDTIRENQDHCDIICVDKCLKHCLDNGITPNFVIVCDANVDYETYLEPVKDKLSDITLFMNVCGNPEWTDNGNWKDVFFFVNKDSLGSDQEFAELSGCENRIAAATNVSNQQVVLLSQCDERGAQNFFGYDKLLLIGYDYCWRDSYYAFDKDGAGKSNYMKSVYVHDHANNFCFTSTNLLFSAKWLDKYVSYYKVPAIQCSKNSIFAGKKIADSLEKQMQYEYKPNDSKIVSDLLKYRRKLNDEIKQINEKIYGIGFDHFENLIRTI